MKNFGGLLMKRYLQYLLHLSLLVCLFFTPQSWAAVDASNVTLLSTMTGFVPQNVVVQGPYAYVSAGSGLYIVNVSNPSSPVQVGFCATPGSARDTDISGNYAYVANGVSGLRIIDVSNPANPVAVGFCDTAGAAQGVAVSGSYAYVADGADGLRIINISNPASPVEVGYCDTPGDAEDVALRGSFAYVADFTGGFRVINVSNPSSPVEVGRCTTPGWAHSVTLSPGGGFAYVGADSAGMSMLNIGYNGPYVIKSYNTPGNAMGLAASGDFVYVADRNSGLRVINVSNTNNLFEVGRYNAGTDAERLAVVGNLVFVADLQAGFQIFQIAAATPTPTMTCTPTAVPTSVYGSWSLIGQGLSTLPYALTETGLTFYQGQLCTGALQSIQRNANAFTRTYDGTGWGAVRNLMAPSTERYLAQEFQMAGSGNTLYACYTESPHYYAPTFSTFHQAVLSRFNGSAWQPLGYATTSPSTSTALSVLVQGQNVYMSYSSGDSSETSGFELHVVRWNGSTFEALGGLVNQSYFQGGKLSCDSNGVLYITYCDRSTGQYRIYVKHWNGQTWQQDGATLEQQSAYTVPQIAIFGEEVYVAWMEYNGTNAKLLVKHLNRTLGTWEMLGSEVSIGYTNDAFQAYGLTVSNDGTPYIVYSLNGRVYVQHWNGNSWLMEGDCLNINPGKAAIYPSIGISNAQVYVTWIENIESTSYSMNVKSLSLAMAPTLTPTQTPIVSVTPTVTITGTATSTSTRTPSFTVTPAVTATPTPTVTVTWTVTTTFTPVTTTYFNDFKYSDDVPPSSPGQLPPGWYDSSIDQSSYVTFRYAATDGLVNLVQTSNQYPAKALTHYMATSLVTAQAHYLHVNIRSLPAGKIYLGLYQKQLNGQYASYIWHTRITAPGLYGVDLSDATQLWNWTTTLQFQIMIFIEGDTSNALGNAVIDSVSITSSLPPTMTPTASPTPTVTRTATVTVTNSATCTMTSTITPTPTPLNETFNYSDDIPLSLPGALPSGWTDYTRDSSCAAYLKYTSTDGLAELSDSQTMGNHKVLSPYQTLDLSQNHIVEVTVNSTPNGLFKFGVYTRNGGWSERSLSAPITSPGTYTVDIWDAGWTGTMGVGVELFADFGDAPTAILDGVRIRSGNPAPTGWVDDFSRTVGVKPTGWRDDTTDTSFGATVVNAGSQATITRTNTNTWGKVLSPFWAACNVSTYPIVEVSVTSITASCSWKLGIQEAEGAFRYWNVSSSSNATGVFQFNYAEITGLTGLHALEVQLVVEGAAGQSIAVDWVRIGQAGSVHGASASGGGKSVKLFVASPTGTPIPTSTQTATPAVTASLTPTSTPTIGVKVDEGQVSAFPNPARGKVTFAYAAPNLAKVTIDIYRLTGERVTRIEERKDGGTQTFTTAWEAAGVAPGIYFCRIVATDASGKEVLNVKKKVALVR